MKLTNSLILLLLFVISINLPASNLDESSSYEITIDQTNPLKAYVKANILAGDTLFMSSNCPNYDYPEGWSTFVKDLKVKDGRKELTPQYFTKSKWALGGHKNGLFQIEYKVDLSFVEVNWDVGNEQAGYFDKQAVYLVSKALFIHGGSDEEFKVTFNIPNEWGVSTPWKEISKNEFNVPNMEFLLENSLVFGRYATSTLNKSGFTFEFALLGKAAQSMELFDETFRKIAAEFLGIFPETPPSKYLITMFYAKQDDGESFFNSNAFTLSKPLHEDGTIIWANQMAHELFHYWNSDLIRAASYSDRQWFSEGSAEYYANLTLLRTGIIDEPTFRSKAEKILGLYINFKWRNRDVTLKEAGQSKGRNRFAVYNGGWAAAFALDLLIIEKTDGKKNLDDFMALMLEKYSSSEYKYTDLVNTASEVVGEDISEFFGMYVDGEELIPIEEFLNKVGYKVYGIIYEAEVYLVFQNEKPLRKLWLER